MKKRVVTVIGTALFFLSEGAAHADIFRLPNVFGNPRREDSRGESPPEKLSPEDRQAIENLLKFLRLSEHKRLSHILSTTYRLRAFYVNAGACARLRQMEITGICGLEAGPADYLSTEMNQIGISEGDESFARASISEANRWKDIEERDKEEIHSMCATTRGRCSTKEKFHYWWVENGKVVNEDVEMLELAALATEESLITHILGSVSDGGPFSPEGNGGDPVKGARVLEEIRNLKNFPYAPSGYYEGDSLPLSSQATNRQRILREVGLGDLEAIGSWGG